MKINICRLTTRHVSHKDGMSEELGQQHDSYSSWMALVRLCIAG